jgi:hypothetical protein
MKRVTNWTGFALFMLIIFTGIDFVFLHLPKLQPIQVTKMQNLSATSLKNESKADQASPFAETQRKENSIDQNGDTGCENPGNKKAFDSRKNLIH